MSETGEIDDIMRMLVADWTGEGKPDEFSAKYAAGEDLHFQGEVEPYFPDDEQDYDEPAGWEFRLYLVHRYGGDPNTDETDRSAVLHRRVIERHETPDATKG